MEESLFDQWWEDNKERIYQKSLSTCWGSIRAFAEKAFIDGRGSNDICKISAAQLYYIANIYPEIVSDDEARVIYETRMGLREKKGLGEGRSYWEAAVNIINLLYTGEIN